MKPRTLACLALLTLLTGHAVAEAPMPKMDSSAFMKMLMAQMKHQDPTKPMDQAKMVQQLSSMTMMQQSAELVNAMNGLKQQVYRSQGLYASDLVGNSVMVVAPRFDVIDNHQPSGEVLLATSAPQLVIRVYRPSENPANSGHLAELDLGPQRPGRVPFDLADLKIPLTSGKYQMRAYVLSNGQKSEQSIAQLSVVESVVIPGAGRDVLVKLRGIGLMPLYAVTEFKGHQKPAQTKALAYMGVASNNTVTVANPTDRTRKGEVWTRNPFFNNQSVKKQLGRRPATLRDTLFRTLN